MARIQDPSKLQRAEPSRRGQGEAEAWLPVSLQSDDCTAIIADLAIPMLCVPTVIHDLEALLADYVHRIVSGRFEVRLPQQKAALERIQRDAPKLARVLEGLDPDVAFLLQLSNLPSQLTQITAPERIAAVALELQRMADAASKQLAMDRFHKRGPSPRHELFWIYQELTRRFEQWSKHKVSFRRVGVLAAAGHPTSRTMTDTPAARFIEAVFKGLVRGAVVDASTDSRIPIATYIRGKGGNLNLLQPAYVINQIEAERKRKARKETK